MLGVALPQGPFGPPRTATITVAAYNASNRGVYDLQCDGIADDVEINAAIAALPSSGGTILLSEGNFACIANLTIPNNVTIAGTGTSTVLTFTGSEVTQCITISGNNVAVKSMKLVVGAGAGQAGARPNLIYASGRNYISISDCYLYGDKTVANDGSNYRQCGIRITNSVRGSIYGNTVENFWQRGIYVSTGYSYSITANQSLGVYWYDFALESVYYSVVENNHVYNSAGVYGQAGFLLYTSVRNSVIGNTVYNSDKGIRLNNSNNNTIQDNVLYANYGVYLLTNSNYNTIAHNVLTGCTISKVYIEPGSSPNYFAHNVDYIAPGEDRNDATITVYSSTAAHPGNAEYVCDGTADDVEINAAIAALPSSGGSIVLSEGEFSITSPISITRHLSIKGMGRGDTWLKLASGANCNVIHLSGGPFYNVQIYDLGIDGNKTNNTSGVGISSVGLAHNVTLRNLYIQYMGDDGIKIYNSTPGIQTNWVIDNVRINSCDGESLWAFYVYGLYVTNSSFSAPGNHNVRLENCGEVWLGNSAFDQCGGYNVSCSTITNSHFHHLYLADGTGTYAYGFLLSGTCTDIRIDHCTAQDMANSSDGFCFTGTLTDVMVDHNVARSNSRAGFRINVDSSSNRVIFTDNISEGNGSDQWVLTNLSGCTFRGNVGYIAPGEVRTYSGSLTAGAANSFAFNWQNPNSSKIIVTRLVIYISTAGGTAGSVLDVGVASSSGVHSDNLIDGLDLNTTGVFDNITEGGANGMTRQLVDENGGTNDWITGQILVANANSLVGRYTIEYMAL